MDTVEESVEYVLRRLEELEVLEDDLLSTYNFDIDKEREQEIKDRLSDLGYLDRN